MKGNQILEVEITIKPPRGRRGGHGQKGEPNAPDPPRIPRIARLMALAIKFQDMVDRGEVRDYADLARLGFVTRARITQIMNLLNLAPQIQEALLSVQSSPNVNPAACERSVRSVSRLVHWADQTAP